MNTNLDKVAQDLYKVLDSRFGDVKFGDENAAVLSKKTDIPKARFFEFEYKDEGVPLGTITITLDEDDGLLVELLGELAKKSHPGVFKLIKGLRLFAKNNIMFFHVEKIGKQNLDKRDYNFRAKPKEFEPMSAMMESRLYGTAKVSYEDLGESRLVIRHSQPVNTALPAGRTMHIESIYIENSQGERFKYPFKHMAGARALAEHLNNGGIPYDGIGKHITGLSEELAQLRMFKGHVTRNSALAEAMDDITPKVIDRIDSIKEEIARLARPAYYKQFAESFAESEARDIPEELLNDWVDRLTVRTFNENLKTAFPYIFKLIDESDLPVKELSADDLLSEEDDEVEHFERGYNESSNFENQFSSFLDSILEDESGQEGTNTLFSSNIDVRTHALEQLKDILKPGLPTGVDGLTASQSLKGIIDSETFTRDYLGKLGSEGDTLTALKLYIADLADGKIQEPGLPPSAEEVAKEIVAGNELDSIKPEGEGDETPVGGEEAPPAEAPPAEPAPAEAPPAEPAPDMTGAPPAPGAEAGMPPAPAPGTPPEGVPPAPVAEDFSMGQDTNYSPMTRTQTESSNPMHEILKSIAGFWNKEARNFTIGGTRVKTIILKNFKNNEYPGARPEDIKAMFAKIDSMDPSSGHDHELGRIKKLAGVGHEHEADEDILFKHQPPNPSPINIRGH